MAIHAWCRQTIRGRRCKCTALFSSSFSRSFLRSKKLRSNETALFNMSLTAYSPEQKKMATFPYWDYAAWASVFGLLAVQFPHLVAMSIDGATARLRSASKANVADTHDE